MYEEEVNAKKEQSPKPMVEILQDKVDEAVHRALFDQFWSFGAYIERFDQENG